jgi:hypothetical protein
MMILHFFLTAVRFWYLLLTAMILLIVGWSSADWIADVGLCVLIIYLLLCLLVTIRTQVIMRRLMKAEPEIMAMMEALENNPNGFLSQMMEQQDQYRDLHGEALLQLSDEDLCGTVYFQCLDLAEECEGSQVDLFVGARRTVYILGLFDSEIQNGGLCQFFVNASGGVAPFVSESLAEVGAERHRKLFDDFISSNQIDVFNLSSFEINSVRQYQMQTKRFDYDVFDAAYSELPDLQTFVASFIRSHISEF